MDFTGEGREGIKSTSVLLVFLSDFNLSDVTGEILLLLKKASPAFEVLWKEKSSFKTMTSVSHLVIHR